MTTTPAPQTVREYVAHFEALAAEWNAAAYEAYENGRDCVGFIQERNRARRQAAAWRKEL